MKKTVFFLLLTMIAFSCSEDELSIESVSGDRFSFTSMEEFHDMYIMLTEFESKEELQYWAKTKNHSTLLNSTDNTVEFYSNALKTILNKDSEFELGEKIVWFNKGHLYAIPKRDEARLNDLKENPELYEEIGEIKLQFIAPSGLKTADLDLNENYVIGLKQFTQKYKSLYCQAKVEQVASRIYLHYLVDESFIIAEGYGGTPDYWRSSLFLRVQFKTGSMTTAYARRDISVNVSGTAYLMGTTLQTNYSINKNYNCRPGDVELLVASFDYGMNYIPYWKVSMSGSIYQKVVEDLPSNAWTNYIFF